MTNLIRILYIKADKLLRNILFNYSSVMISVHVYHCRRRKFYSLCRLRIRILHGQGLGRGYVDFKLTWSQMQKSKLQSLRNSSKNKNTVCHVHNSIIIRLLCNLSLENRARDNLDLSGNEGIKHTYF